MLVCGHSVEKRSWNHADSAREYSNDLSNSRMEVKNWSLGNELIPTEGIMKCVANDKHEFGTGMCNFLFEGLFVCAAILTSYAHAQWSTFKGDELRGSDSIGQTLLPPLELKSYLKRNTTPGPTSVQYSSPSFGTANGTDAIAYGSNDGALQLYAAFPLLPGPSGYDSNIWRKIVSGSIYASPEILNFGTGTSPNRVYVPSTDGFLHCYNLDINVEIWKSAIGGSGFSSPISVQSGGISTVYVGSNDSHLYAFDAVTGALTWPLPFKADGYLFASPIYDATNGNVVIPSYGGSLYSVKASTGVLAWPARQVGATRGTPALTNGVIWSLSNDGRLFGTNALDGSSAFDTFTSGKFASASPAASYTPGFTFLLLAFEDGTVVYRRYQDGVPSSGVNLWSISIGLGTSFEVHSSPTIANGFAYLGTKGGTLVILNLSNGQVAQQLLIPGNAGVEGNPAISNDTLYFVSNNGDVAIYGMPVSKISISGPRHVVAPSGIGTAGTYTLTAVDSNGNVVPTFTENLSLASIAGTAMYMAAGSINFARGIATATLVYPGAGGSRIQVSTNNGARTRIWDPLDIFVDDGVPVIPPIPTGYSYYNYMVVENHSATVGKTDSTLQISDGSGFFDAEARVVASPSKLRSDAADIRIYDDKGSIVNHQVVTNPQHVNTVIRFNVSYLAPEEKKYYLMAFGNPSDSFPIGYDTTPYLNSIYNFADAFDGTALDPTKFSVTTGSPAVVAGSLAMNFPFSFGGRPKPLDSSYGVRYEFKAGGGIATDPIFNLGWALKDADPVAQSTDFRFTTGSGGGTNIVGYAYGTGFPVNDGAAERKYFITKAAPGLILGGRDVGNAATTGVDFGINTGGTGSGPLANPLPGSCYPMIDGSLNSNPLDAKFDWVIGWEIHQDHPTATLLKLSDPVPNGWPGGAVTNDPVTETAWTGFDFEDTLDLKLPIQANVLTGITNPVDVIVKSGKAYVLDGSLNSIHIYDASLHTDLGSIPVAVTQVAAMAYDSFHNWIWVTDSGGAKVVAIDLSGTAQAQITQGDVPLQQPSGITVDSKGQIYLADNGNNRIYSYDANRTLKWATGAEGYEVGHFENIQRLVFDEKRGLLYVADAANYRVAVIDKSGYAIRQFPRSSQSQVDVQWPIGVSLDLAGDLVVTDADLGRLVVSNPNGDYIGATDPSVYQFMSPTAAVQASDSSWWVVDTGNHRVVHYSNASGSGGDVNTARAGVVKVRSARKFLPEGKIIIAAPNPSKDQVRVGVWLDDAARARLTMVNLAGEVVRNMDLGELPAGETVFSLDISKYASGVYFLVYQVEGQFGFRPKETFKMAIVK